MKRLIHPKTVFRTTLTSFSTGQKNSEYIGQIAQNRLAIIPTIWLYRVDVTLLLEATYMIRRDSLTGSGNGTVGYVRRSTDKQEQSIEDQKNAISAYIAENGLRFLRFYIDDAISGTSTLGRRAFQQMIKDAESSPRPFDIIAVYDIKRFGRIDNDEAGYYRYLLRTHGIEVRYVSENFNGDTTDDLLRPVKQWQARSPKTCQRSQFEGCFQSPGAASGWAAHLHMDMTYIMKVPIVSFF